MMVILFSQTNYNIFCTSTQTAKINETLHYWGSRGLMDRALDLKPEVVGSNPGSGRNCPRLRKDTEPPTAPRAPQCRLPTAPLGWVKCREHISLLIILCIIVYVTNKAHLSLICICCIVCTVQMFGVVQFYNVLKKHIFDQKDRKMSNIVKYYYSLNYYSSLVTWLIIRNHSRFCSKSIFSFLWLIESWKKHLF